MNSIIGDKKGGEVYWQFFASMFVQLLCRHTINLVLERSIERSIVQHDLTSEFQ